MRSSDGEQQHSLVESRVGRRQVKARGMGCYHLQSVIWLAPAAHRFYISPADMQMSKGMSQKREAKRKPEKTLEEKRAQKRAKRAARSAHRAP